MLLDSNFHRFFRRDLCTPLFNAKLCDSILIAARPRGITPRDWMFVVLPALSVQVGSQLASRENSVIPLQAFFTLQPGLLAALLLDVYLVARCGVYMCPRKPAVSLDWSFVRFLLCFSFLLFVTGEMLNFSLLVSL